jgi:hypothetical protein
MTHQFKFGDLMRRKSDGATGVVIHAQFQSVWFVLKGNLTVNADYAEEFEIIPHPDTVRLDWFADKHNKIGSVLLPRECVEKHLDNMRDAIDAAMKLSADN